MNSPETAHGVLQVLLGDLAEGRPFLGYRLISVTPHVPVRLSFSKDGRLFQVFIAPRYIQTNSYRETARFRVGYSGDAPDRDAFRLLDEVASRVTAREAMLADAAFETWAGLEARDAGLRVRRGVLELRVTLACNERCPFCNTDRSAENVVTDPRRVEDAIRSAPDLGAHSIVFTGGEPTLLRRLPEWVRTCRSLGLVTWIQSNGIRPGTEGFWDRFEARSGGVRPDHLYLSFHTMRPDRLEALTGVAGTFARKVRAVHEARRRGMVVGLNFVATTLNLDELADLPGYVAREFGTDVPVDLSLVAPNGHCRDRMDLIPRIRDAVPWFAAALDAAAKVAVSVQVMEVCGFPPCTMPGHLDAFPSARKRIEIAALPPDRVKGPGCASCRLDRFCLGLWRRYAEVHGYDELSPQS